MVSIDVERIKMIASGREAELLEYVAHLDRGILDGKHHSCPKCGGTDRFRFDRKKGFCICNQCFASKNGDVLAAIQHFRGIDFPTALAETAHRLGVEGMNGHGKAGQGQDPLVRLAEKKRCPVDSLRAFGGQGNLTKRSVSFPMYNLGFPSGEPEQCSTFTVWPDSDDPKFAKGLNAKDKPAGMFLPHLDGKPVYPKPGETWLVCEGCKDASALHAMGFQVIGLPGKSIKSEWLPMFRAVDVILCLDNDHAGQEATIKAVAALRTVARSVRTVSLPAPGDVRDNIAAVGQDAVKAAIEAAADASGQEDEGKPVVPKARTVRELVAEFPRLRTPSIYGLLRVGETLNVIAPPKTGKSWLASDLAIHKAIGRSWLDAFDVEPGLVLMLDNELHGETIAHRLPKVAESRNIAFDDYADRIQVVSLRGHLCDVYGIGGMLEQFTPAELDGALVVVDAFYRVLPPGCSENDNAAIAAVYNEFDALAMNYGCSFVLIHHSTKGNQAGKAVTDVGAGAGSQARATDSHLVLRQHAEPGHFVLEAAVRSWAPVEPLVLKWNWPVWQLATGMDPAALKTDRPRPVDRLAEVKDEILKAFVHFPEGATKRGIQDRTGRPTCWNKALAELLDEGQVVACDVPSKVHDKPDSGFKRVYQDEEF